MPRLMDLTGQQFGRLTVVKRASNSKGGSARWACSCDCGTINKRIDAKNLRNGRSKSCGCLTREVARQNLLDNPIHVLRIYVKGKKYPNCQVGGHIRALKRRPDGLSIRRIAKSLTIEEAASRIGIKPRTLYGIEGGRAKFGPKCDAKEVKAIYGDLSKFGKRGGEKHRHCLVCNSVFSGEGKTDNRRSSTTFGKIFSLCSAACRSLWYKGELFTPTIRKPLMDAPRLRPEPVRDREKAEISSIVRENLARSKRTR